MKGEPKGYVFGVEKFERGQRCKGRRPQLYYVIMEEAPEEELEYDIKDLTTNELAHISVNAINGTTALRTMEVTGYLDKRRLHILLDSGSTHNFIDQTLAYKLGCLVSKIPPMLVTVADGGKLVCNEAVENFTWKINGHTFSTTTYLIPLLKYDMILGVVWLCSLGDIICNFSKLTLTLEKDGQKVVLRGSHDNSLQ